MHQLWETQSWCRTILKCELGIFTFKVLYLVMFTFILLSNFWNYIYFYICILFIFILLLIIIKCCSYIKAKETYNAFMVPCEKKQNSFLCFFNNENLVIFSAPSKFPVKSICYILLLKRHQVLVIYLYLLQLTYNVLWNRDNLAKCQLYNYLLDHFQPFDCSHMFLIIFIGLSNKVSS